MISIVATVSSMLVSFLLANFAVFPHSAVGVAVPPPQNYKTAFFVGDIMLARHVETLQSLYGNDYPFAGLALRTLSSTTPYAAIGNFEGAVAENHVQTPDYTMSFSVASTTVPALAAAGFTHVSMANNHSLDKGIYNFSYTKNTLLQFGIRSFGVPGIQTEATTALVTIDGSTVALVGFDDTITPLTETDITAALRAASVTSDFQVVYIHWGDEYKTTHNQRQETLAQMFVQAGVDAVVGSHPHVVQDIAYIDDVPVFYSLGNYIFDQDFSAAVQTGLLLQMSVVDNRLAFKLFPIESQTAPAQPRLLTSPAREQFLKTLALESDPVLYPNIIDGVLTASFASNTKQVTIKE